jgi:hypothetical protein
MSLEQVTVTIKESNKDGHTLEREVEGWALAYVDGLAVTPKLIPSIYVYNITHIDTGLAVLANIYGIVPAINALDELDGLDVDWTTVTPGMVLSKNQKRRLEQIKAKYEDKE